MGADTKAKRLGGGGLRGWRALEVDDVCLLEDGSEREGALGSNAVVSETASEGQDGKQ